MKTLATALLLFLFIACCPFLSSADNTVDSLYQLVNKSPNAEKKLELYVHLMEYMGDLMDTQLVILADEVIAFSKKENLPEGVAQARKIRGNFYLKTARREEAMQELLVAEDIFKNNDNLSEQATTKLILQYLYRRKGDNEREKELIDEAVVLAKRAGDNNVLGNAYREKGRFAASSGKPSEALEYFDLALEVLTEPASENVRARVLLSKGIFLNSTDSEAAYPLFLEAQSIAKKSDDLHFLLRVNGTIFSVLNYRGELSKAMELAFENLKLAERLEDPSLHISAFRNIGKVYCEGLENIEQALVYFQQAKEVATSNDLLLETVIMEYEIGNAFFNNEEYEKALPPYQKALDGLIKLGRRDFIPEVQADIGMCHLEIGNLEKAYELFSSITDGSSTKNPEALHKAFNGLGTYYYQKKNYSKSIQYLEKVYDHASKGGHLYLAENASQYLYKSNKAISQPTRALHWFETHAELKDSTLNQKNVAKMTSLKMNAQFEKEKERIALEQQQEEALLKAEIKQSRTIAFAIGGLALLALGFLWYLRRKNQTISEQNHQLEQLNQTKDRLFSIIGHDLRKPALAFRGIAKKVNYLLKKEDFNTLEQLGNEIEKDALSLNQLTDNLLNWALTQKEVMPYQPQALKLGQMVEEELAVFHNLASNKRVELLSNVQPDLEVYADANALRTIIRNLVDNALKFSSEGGEVKIIAESGNKGVAINIEDKGTGMPEDKLKDIFLLQKGKSQEGTAGEKGTGLGLFLVNELVNLNKGAIEVVSQLGQGTKFSLYLPARAVA